MTKRIREYTLQKSKYTACHLIKSSALISSDMLPLYHTAAIRAMERLLFARENSFAVMRRAGVAVAQRALALAGDNSRPILVVAGPGNNGGDAFIAAQTLRETGRKVHMVFLGESKKLSADARQALTQWGETPTAEIIPDDYALIIDGIFGIGLKRPPQGIFAATVQEINAMRCPILAIDVPSGIDNDSGAAPGGAVVADETITFFAAKPGLHTGEGIHCAGKVMVENLGFTATDKAALPSGWLMDAAPDMLRLRRAQNTHKGNYGALAVVGGDAGMLGAVALATRAAVRLGAGKVYAVALDAKVPPFDFVAPEVMWRRADSPWAELPLQAAAIGVGLGVSDVAAALLKQTMELPLPLVVDADGLNLLAADQSLGDVLAARQTPTILTPHPAEAARLLHCETAAVAADRIGAAKMLAAKFRAAVILKGAGSVIIDDDNWCICAAGNPGLAQAGAGDVLTGFVGALLAQTQDAMFAARAAAWLHAAAADKLAKEDGKIGLNINSLGKTAAQLLAMATDHCADL